MGGKAAFQGMIPKWLLIKSVITFDAICDNASKEQEPIFSDTAFTLLEVVSSRMLARNSCPSGVRSLMARLSELMEKEGVDVEEKAIRYVAKFHPLNNWTIH